MPHLQIFIEQYAPGHSTDAHSRTRNFTRDHWKSELPHPDHGLWPLRSVILGWVEFREILAYLDLVTSSWTKRWPSAVNKWPTCHSGIKWMSIKVLDSKLLIAYIEILKDLIFKAGLSKGLANFRSVRERVSLIQLWILCRCWPQRATFVEYLHNNIELVFVQRSS